MNNRKGFTLVELLAVIAILAILVILALPNVMNMYVRAKKNTFLTEAKKVYSEAEKKFISNSISDKPAKVINSEDNTKLDMTGEKLQYCIILDNKGKVTSMKVSNGKWIASLDNGKTVDDLSIDDLEEGSLDGYKCSSKSVNSPEAIYCTFDGDMVQGASYVNGQYTYRYMQDGYHGSHGLFDWKNMDTDGWGVRVNSEGDITSKLCTYINNKPIVSMSLMIYGKNISSIDLSSYNTSNVTNMQSMFEIRTGDSRLTKLDLSNFDTSNVTDMNGMFFNINVEELDVSKFNTSKVTNMSGMFSNSQVNSLDLSNFDTSNVTNMRQMFSSCSKLKTIYASDKFITNKVTLSDAMFNNSTNLVGDTGTAYDSNNVDKTYARIDGGTSSPGYFTKK